MFFIPTILSSSFALVAAWNYAVVFAGRSIRRPDRRQPEEDIGKHACQVEKGTSRRSGRFPGQDLHRLPRASRKYSANL